MNNINKQKKAFSLRSLLTENDITSFFIRLLVLVSLWFVLYHVILKPKRIIDRPLTNFISMSVSKAINAFTPDHQIAWRDDSENGRRAYLTKNGLDYFGIYDVCNGIDLMFIYVGIISLLPFAIRRKILFSLAGIAIIVLANIIRVTALYYIYIYYNPAFEFSHHYVFTILMYILIFYGWILFIKKKTNEQGG